MLDLIHDALLEHGDIISDLETSGDFDMMFYTMYCPYVEEDGIARMTESVRNLYRRCKKGENRLCDYTQNCDESNRNTG